MGEVCIGSYTFSVIQDADETSVDCYFICHVLSECLCVSEHRAKNPVVSTVSEGMLYPRLILLRATKGIVTDGRVRRLSSGGTNRPPGDEKKPALSTAAGPAFWRRGESTCEGPGAREEVLGLLPRGWGPQGACRRAARPVEVTEMRLSERL